MLVPVENQKAFLGRGIPGRQSRVLSFPGEDSRKTQNLLHEKLSPPPILPTRFRGYTLAKLVGGAPA